MAKILYDPKSEKPFKLSRSKIDLFFDCPKCFFLDRKLGIGRPPGFPFTLNSAVDTLLKEEFDGYRRAGKKHPLILEYEVDAIPVSHKDLNKWRENFVGIQFHHKLTNFVIFGAIDDLWQNSKGEYIVVDYKATAINDRITELNKEWHGGYKRQMETYQWLLRQNGYKVSDTGYFVYCNGIKNKKSFDKKLEFEITLIPYKGSDNWVEPKLIEIKRCLSSDNIPEAKDGCPFCNYIDNASNLKKEKLTLF